MLLILDNVTISAQPEISWNFGLLIAAMLHDNPWTETS